MLVLNRRPNESIQIGPNIEVSVLAIRRKKVRLLITAPAGVQIRRAERHDSHTRIRVILNCKTGESIRIGAHIQVTVTRISTYVRLGIVTPLSVPVLRG
jgi:carbon storage regulator CsrA